VIEKTAKKSAAYEWELMKKSYEEDEQFLKEHGIQFIKPDEEEVGMKPFASI
jgi:TRAP-type transport system periplasmic protein